MKAKESHMTNMTKFYLLMLLSRKKMHGYALIQELGKITGKKPSAGQIYPLLQELVRNGHLKKQRRQRQIVYSITSAGKKTAKDMISRFADIIDIVISSKIEKCFHCSCEIYKGGFRHGSRIYCCRACFGS